MVKKEYIIPNTRADYFVTEDLCAVSTNDTGKVNEGDTAGDGDDDARSAGSIWDEEE